MPLLSQMLPLTAYHDGDEDDDDDTDVYNDNHVHDDEIMQMLMMIKLLCLWASPLAQCTCYLKSFHFSLCIFAERE